MTIYAQVCGYTLAHAHARSGDALSIAGYVGGGTTMARAMASFAAAYADQNDADYHAFKARTAADRGAVATALQPSMTPASMALSIAALRPDTPRRR